MALAERQELLLPGCVAVRQLAHARPQLPRLARSNFSAQLSYSWGVRPVLCGERGGRVGVTPCDSESSGFGEFFCVGVWFVIFGLICFFSVDFFILQTLKDLEIFTYFFRFCYLRKVTLHRFIADVADEHVVLREEEKVRKLSLI